MYYTAGVWAVGCTLPFYHLLRYVIRTLGFVTSMLGGRRIFETISRKLPIAVPGYAGASPIPVMRSDGTRHKVAVIGGGISGVGCAYSLQKSGYDVTVYEARDELGGNAQTMKFEVGGKEVTQDLSVLFWAPEYYKNYMQLLKAVEVEPEIVSATYLLHTNVTGKPEYYTPKGTHAEKVISEAGDSMEGRFKNDLEKFDRMVKIVRWTNNAFTWDPEPSFYKHAGIWPIFNPMNFISIKTMTRLCGISQV